jgi:long-chain fatty acid transport protein
MKRLQNWPVCGRFGLDILTRFVAVVALLLPSLPALSAGFMVRENSAEAIATSYAGNGSRASGPDTVFANPAGMTKLISGGFEAGAVAILPSLTFSGEARQRGVPIAGNDGGDHAGAALLPNFYGVVRLSDAFSAGIAITAPFGDAIDYGNAWYGRYLGIRTSVLSTDINPAVAWQIDQTWSVGAGVSAQLFKADITSGIDQTAIFGVASPDAFYRFKAHDWALGFNGGVLADFGDGTRLGLTYRSAINHRMDGSLDFMAASPLLGLVNGAASAKSKLPATTGLSVTREINTEFTLSAEAQFTQWSVFKDVIIESQNMPLANAENYRDSWMVALGGIWRLDDHWSLKGGVAFDETPVTSRYRTVTVPDTDRYLLGVGAAYRLNDVVTVEGAYGHAFAFLHPNMNSSINNTDSITHSVSLKGKFDIMANIVALSFRYST